MLIPTMRISTFFRSLVLVALLSPSLVLAHAAGTPKSVFVVGECLDRISAPVLSSLEVQVRSSQKYRLVNNLGDGDEMGIVWTINVNWSERKNVAAIAIVFGVAKCFSATNCHHAIDGSSVRAKLCDVNDITRCGQELFKAFEDFMNNPIRSTLRLN